MRFLLKDRTNMSFATLGTADLAQGVMPSDIVRLARDGFLLIQPEPDENEVEARNARNKAEEEARMAAHLSEVKKHQEECQVPEDFASYDDLSAKQLKALCQKRGLKINGNKFDYIDRLEKDDAAQRAKPKKAVQEPEPEPVKPIEEKKRSRK